MASGVNKVILIGNLGKDPEIRYTTHGSVVANFTIATSETWKDKNSGERKQKTEWHRIVFWGSQAEIIGKYLAKGSQVYIEGKIQTRKYQDNNGQDRYITEVIGKEFLMIGNRQNQNQNQQGGQYPQGQQNPQQNLNNQYADGGGYSGVPSMEDDIPF